MRFPFGAKPIGVDFVKQAIDEFNRLPISTPADKRRESATRALVMLQRKIDDVQKNAGDYPNNSITADVWFDGALLGSMAEGFAVLLNNHALYEFEEKAQTLRCMAVLAVQSHYHHIVGPAMVARAECNERLGNTDVAVKTYEGVIADFSWFVEEWEADLEPPTDVDRCSLQSLSFAIEGSLRLISDGDRARSLQALHARCNSILARAPREDAGGGSRT